MCDASIYINGLCRCCHARGRFKSLGVPYMVKDREEIYEVIIRETFDVIICPQIGENSASTYTICESCIVSLQDAARFKQQVLTCEGKLIKLLLEEDSQVKVESLNTDLKNEYSEDDNREDLIILDLKQESNENTKAKEPERTTKRREKRLTLTSSLCKRKKLSAKSNRQKTDAEPVFESDKDIDSAPLFKKQRRRIRETKDVQNFTCKVCSEKFTPHGLKIHMKTHQAFTCHMCRHDFTKYSELIKHIETTHAHGTRYPCKGCNEVLNSAKLLHRHLNKHYNDEPVRCGECVKEIRRKCLANHMRICHARTFICDYCNRIFHAKNNLIRHIFQHTGKKPYVCDVCGKTFSRADIFKDHMALHSVEQRYKCFYCPKQFFVKQNLRTHERQHTEAKKFVCKICEKSFHLKRSLKTHMVTHTGEKPFHCEVCQKRFQFKGTVKLHMRTHTGEKPFSCEICNKSFRQKQTLKGHMRIHTGEKAVTCDLCNAALASQNSLKVHMRRHTGDKYTCKVCNKQISNLYDHMKVHRRVNKCI